MLDFLQQRKILIRFQIQILNKIFIMKLITTVALLFFVSFTSYSQEIKDTIKLRSIEIDLKKHRKYKQWQY